MENKDLTNIETSNTNSKTETNFLDLLGIKLEDGKIEIDTNKTKGFFESLQKSVEKKAEDISAGKVDLESVGVKVNDEKIEVDLNKTKSVLDDIAKKAKNFVEMLDKSFSDLSKK